MASGRKFRREMGERFILAGMEGDAETMRKMIEGDVAFEYNSFHVEKIIKIAAERGDVETLRVIIDYEEPASFELDSALRCAAENCEIDALSILVDAGSRVKSFMDGKLNAFGRGTQKHFSTVHPCAGEVSDNGLSAFQRLPQGAFRLAHTGAKDFRAQPADGLPA